MGGRQQLTILAAHLVVAVLLISAATVLVALHDLRPEAAVGLFFTAIGLLGGSAAALGTIGATTNGKAVVPKEHLTELTHAAAQRRSVDMGARPGERPAPSAAASAVRDVEVSDLLERMERLERVLLAAATSREPAPAPPAGA